MELELLTRSAGQTKRAGRKLAREVLKSKFSQTALVIALTGELGGGKTTFLQGFAEGLGVEEKVLSPTFIIMRRTKVRMFHCSTQPKSKFQNFYHIDCYRIKKPKELLDLGFKEIISDPRNIVAVEWADKIIKLMPKNSLFLNFEFIDENTRRIKLSAH